MRINRFLLIILIGLALYLIYGAGLIFWNWNSGSQASELARSLLANFVSDVVFFGLVGLTGVVAQFYADHGDVLQQRLRKLFANEAVSLPVLDFFEEIARTNAVYAVEARHVVSILEFREDIFAYRGEFKNTYLLRNAFGDIPYEAELFVEVAPDFSRSGTSPFAVVSRLRLTVAGNEQSFIDAPIKLEKGAFRKPILVSLPKNGEAMLELHWWSWIDALGHWDSGFSTKRFAERFSVAVVNQSPVDLVISHHEDGEDITVPYDAKVVIYDEKNVAPKTRVEFYWRPPSEKIPPPDLARGERLTHLLDFDRKFGESDVRQL